MNSANPKRNIFEIGKTEMIKFFRAFSLGQKVLAILWILSWIAAFFFFVCGLIDGFVDIAVVGIPLLHGTLCLSVVLLLTRLQKLEK